MRDARVYFSLGSNLGDRSGALHSAYERLSEHLHGPSVSSIYETEPLYVTDQPRFLNCVCGGSTNLDPLGCLDLIRRIESALGRVRLEPKGPRTVDVDLLLFGAARIHTERLVVPHPAIHERAFVLVPLLEIAPALRDPVTGEPYRASLDRLQTAGVSYFRAWDG